MSQNLSAQLKKVTKENHQQLEKLLVTLLKQVVKREDYVKILKLFYGYFGALEDKINLHVGTAELPDYLLRRKTESIANDIKIMGGVLPSKAKDADLPIIENSLQAFGALYVIEGSTLGGKIIHQMMEKKLNLTDNEGISFFKGYGDQTESKWASFKERLNSQIDNQKASPVIINSANETFLKFKTWIEKNS